MAVASGEAEGTGSAGPRYPQVSVRIQGRKPAMMVEIVQMAMLKANLGSAAYRFRGETALSGDPVEDVIRRWVTSDLPVEEADDKPSGPGF